MMLDPQSKVSKFTLANTADELATCAHYLDQLDHGCMRERPLASPGPSLVHLVKLVVLLSPNPLSDGRMGLYKGLFFEPLFCTSPQLVEDLPPASNLQPPASSLQPSAFSLQPPTFSLQPPASNLQPSASSLQPSASSLQPPDFSLQLPAFSLQPLASSL